MSNKLFLFLIITLLIGCKPNQQQSDIEQYTEWLSTTTGLENSAIIVTFSNKMLTKLSITSLDADSLSFEGFYFESMRELKIQNGTLVNLKGLSGMPNLEICVLDDNQISEVPNIADTKMRHFSMANNHIKGRLNLSVFPQTIESIVLSYNKLNHVVSDTLANLIYLNLGYNELITLPKNLCALYNLEEFFLNGCKAEDYLDLRCLTQLEELSLRETSRNLEVLTESTVILKQSY